MLLQSLLNLTKRMKLVLMYLTTLFLFLPWTVSAQLIDRVVAVVDDDVITLSELDETGKEYLNKVRENTPLESRDTALMMAREKLLDTLIEQLLISKKAKQGGIEISDKEFEAAYKKNVAGLNLSQEQLLQKLQESGLSEKNYKDNMRNQMLRDKLVLFEVRSKVIVTEEMTLNYYENDYVHETTGGGYYILQMGFSWEQKQGADPGKMDKAAARIRAEEARQLVIEGADFSEIAKKNSNLPSAADGGDLGLFQEDEMAPYMRDAILPLKAGELSEIIETPDGFQFFKLVSFQDGDIVYQAPYYEVKENIQKKLFEEKFKQEFRNWVDEIKKGAYIKKMLL